jgi:hypothetical protein
MLGTGLDMTVRFAKRDVIPFENKDLGGYHGKKQARGWRRKTHVPQKLLVRRGL